MSFLSTLLLKLRTREEGQTMAEYAVVLAVITIAIIATLGALSGAIDGALQAVIGVLPG
jgi:Flp pilus assembly pilin Flp